MVEVDSKESESKSPTSVKAEALLAIEQSLASASVSSLDAVITYDQHLKITSWNEGAESMFLHAQGEAIGQSIGILLREPSCLKDYFAFSLDRAKLRDQQLELIKKDKSAAQFSLSFSPILGKDDYISGVSVIARNISSPKEIETMLQFQHTLLDLVLNSIAEGLIVVDTSGKVTLFNRAAEGILGRQPDKGVPQDLRETFKPYLPDDGSLCPPEQLPLTLALAGQVVKDVQLMILVPGQDARFISCSADPLYGAEGMLHGAVVVFREVTKERQISLALQDSVKALERSNKDLEQFASVAAHDLQEPLRSVNNYLEMFLGVVPVTDAEPVRYVGKIRAAIKRMQALINALLNYARIESRGQPFTQVDCNTLVENCIEDLRSSVNQSQAQITYSNLPKVWGDESQIGQVFENLLSNAIKFNKANPKIEITAARLGKFWEISVSDDGIGIPPAFHERVFLIFQRLHPANAYTGTGIGLSLCKRIVERHGGSISLESVANQGCTFKFTLPGVEVMTK